MGKAHTMYMQVDVSDIRTSLQSICKPPTLQKFGDTDSDGSEVVGDRCELHVRTVAYDIFSHACTFMIPDLCCFSVF